MNKSSSLPDMAMLRRRQPSDSSSMSRPESTTSLASSSSPDSLVAHLKRGSSFVRDHQLLLQNSASQPQLRRNPASMLDLATILTDAAEFMDDYGNDGDEAISWTPRQSSKDPSVGGPSPQ